MGNIIQFAADKLMNVVSGLNIPGRDKAASSFFGQNLMLRQQLDAAYRNDWIARKVVDQLVRDMTREWRAWQGPKVQIQQLEAEEHRLQVRQKVARAKTLARLYGGSAILIGDGTANPEQELRVDQIAKGGIKFLHVLHRYEITPDQPELDPMSPYFGQPQFYNLNNARGGQVKVHPSRMVRFCGAGVPDPKQSQTNGWGDSVLQALDEAVKSAASVQSNIASLIYEAKIDVLRVPGLMEMVATQEYQDRLTQRLTTANLSKSTFNTLLLDKDEEWETREVSFAGMPDIIRTYLDIAAGAAGYPVAIFLGISPAGLNATGQADIRNYYDRVSSEQDSTLRPELEPLDDVLIRSATGRRPPGISYLWNSLWQLTDQEKSDIALKKSQTINLYGRLGVMSRDALAKATQNMLVQDDLFPGLPDILKDPKAAVPSEPIGGGKADNGPADKKDPPSD